MALCRNGWRVVYEEKAKAWTEAPASLDALWRQRYRWCYGTLQAMWKHRGALAQRGPAGKLGRRGLLYLLLFQVLLPLLAPVVDIFALYGLIFLDPVRITGLWLAFLLLQFMMGLYAFRLDGERAGPLWSLPLQQFVYRQLMYLVVIQSVFTAISGTRLRWQRMERYGSLQAPTITTTGTAGTAPHEHTRQSRTSGRRQPTAPSNIRHRRRAPAAPMPRRIPAAHPAGNTAAVLRDRVVPAAGRENADRPIHETPRSPLPDNMSNKPSARGREGCYGCIDGSNRHGTTLARPSGSTAHIERP